MEQAKHTNWTFENDEEGVAGNEFEQWLIRDASSDNGDIVAIVPKTGDEEFDDTVTYPRARLIAAAPELLEALQACIPVIDKAFDFDEGDVFGIMHNSALDALDAAQAAIAKATGAQQ